MVWVNCYKRVHPGSPFGGVGLSGYGRDMGFDAMREYTQVKSNMDQCGCSHTPLVSALKRSSTCGARDERVCLCRPAHAGGYSASAPSRSW